MSQVPYRVHLQASLAQRNTLRVPVLAERLIEVDDPSALPEVLALPEVARGPVRVLGGGSNLLLTADLPGTLIRLCNTDVHWSTPNADSSLVQVAAGYSWHDWVMASLQQGWQGLENLALIPGTVGAAPIQNIGAYGLEVGERIVAVHAFDRQSAHFVILPAAECGFGYRDSVFKQQPDRFIVTAVSFQLERDTPLRTHYQGIAEELAAAEIGKPTALDVANAVIRLRQRKLPDPAELPNAGSFFKNPWVDAETLASLRHLAPDLVFWPQAGGAKLSAGWLIERAGLKGTRHGDAGMAPKHALVLVNYGRASGLELLDFARFVQASVREKFGLDLEIEPVRWP